MGAYSNLEPPENEMKNKRSQEEFRNMKISLTSYLFF
jgi:hypothetical protein